MAKKERVRFTYPRWKEIASAAPGNALSVKTLAALEGGRPLARSTIRKALMAAHQASGIPFYIGKYIVDQHPAR